MQNNPILVLVFLHLIQLHWGDEKHTNISYWYCYWYCSIWFNHTEEMVCKPTHWGPLCECANHISCVAFDTITLSANQLIALQVKEVQFIFAYFLSHFIRIQIFQIVTWFIFSPCKNQPYEFVGTKSGSESSQKVQKCQFWKFLKWETAAYLWTFFTFKNPIEPHKPIVHWEGIVVADLQYCGIVYCIVYCGIVQLKCTRTSS